MSFLRKSTLLQFLLLAAFALTAFLSACDTNDECEGDSLCIHGFFQSTADCTCFCFNRWEGVTCNECPLEASDCPNGTVNPDICDCDCDPAFCGPDCNIVVQECQNGGSWNDFTCSCDCPEGWLGAVCDSIG